MLKRIALITALALLVCVPAAGDGFDDQVWIISDAAGPLHTSLLNVELSDDSDGAAAIYVADGSASSSNATYCIRALSTSSTNDSYAAKLDILGLENVALFTDGLDMTEFSDPPANPDAGRLRIYALDDHTLHALDSTGTDTDLMAGGGGGGSMDDWILSGDSGTNQTVDDGETVEINGDGSGIDAVAGATNTIVVSFDPSEITTYAAPTGFNITVNSAATRRSIMLQPYNMWASQTNGASSHNGETATNKQTLKEWRFNGLAKAYVEFATPMPDNWDGGTIYATFYWSTEATDSKSVRWEMQGRSYGDAETIDQAWGTSQGVKDTCTATAGQLLISAETSAITLAGTPAAGELVLFRAFRDPTHTDDDELGNADLDGIKVEYTINKYTE